jgi:hypothetical protein
MELMINTNQGKKRELGEICSILLSEMLIETFIADCLAFPLEVAFTAGAAIKPCTGFFFWTSGGV